MAMEEGIERFLEDVEPRILERGQEYYNCGQVDELERDGLHVTAEVSGSRIEPYQVEVDFSEDGEVEDWSCDCPYDWGDVCKHTVAVLLAVQEMPPEEETQTEKTETQNLQELVAQAEKEQLAALLLEQEEQTDLLMEQVRLQPGTVFRYGNALLLKHGREVRSLCAAVIREEAKRMYGRTDCQQLCEKILALRQFGGSAEARDIIGKLRQEYPRRPALQDELNQAEKKL